MEFKISSINITNHYRHRFPVPLRKPKFKKYILYISGTRYDNALNIREDVTITKYFNSLLELPDILKDIFEKENV